MYLPGQQSSNPANLTEPELPVAIPKCPAIHFHFLVSLVSHCTFSDFLLDYFWFCFFFTAIMVRKMLLAAVFNPKESLKTEPFSQEYFGSVQSKMEILFSTLS